MLPRVYNEQHKWNKDTIIQHFAKTIYFFPIFKVVNIKQWQIELVREELGLDVYDAIYEKFISYHEGTVKKYISMTRKEQWHFTKQELKSYIHLNGGIFR